jgi:hypothetical protein
MNRQKEDLLDLEVPIYDKEKLERRNQFQEKKKKKKNHKYDDRYDDGYRGKAR